MFSMEHFLFSNSVLRSITLLKMFAAKFCASKFRATTELLLMIYFTAEFRPNFALLNPLLLNFGL